MANKIIQLKDEDNNNVYPTLITAPLIFINSKNISPSYWNVYASKSGSICELAFNASVNMATMSDLIAIADLPTGYRPKLDALITSCAQDGKPILYQISTTGELSIYAMNGINGFFRMHFMYLTD